MYYNGTWGTVCDDFFNDTDTRVVCYMLGYGHSGRSIGNRYGAGSGQIWLDNVQCRGTERSIVECRHNGWGFHNCVHDDDVSVSCPLVTVRLVGSKSPREGRLEVNYRDTWGTVCDGYFSDTDAGVVCYMLGYGRTGQYIGNRFGAGSGQIWLDDVWCRGTEMNIADCGNRGWGRHDCTHHQDVSVSCPTVTVRLAGGGTPQEGRLEVTYNRTMGTVCDGGFSDAAASVVCYMLGYGRCGWVIGNRYGASNGTIWLDNVQCNGTETSIADCQHSGWGNHNCGHDETVSVSCVGDSPPDIMSLSSTIQTGSMHSGSNSNSEIVIAVVVVLGLIICVIIIGLFLYMYFRQRPQWERTEVSMIPMPVIASTNGHNNDTFDNTTEYDYADPFDNAQASDNNAFSPFQQPSNPVAGAEGGIGTGDIEHYDTAMASAMCVMVENPLYIPTLDDKQQHCKV